MAYCNACGHTVSESARTCPSCGHPLAGAEGASWVVTLLLALFFGGLGFHRFYTGHTVLGLLYLFTLGLCGVGQIIDVILILMNSYRDAQGRPLVR